MLVELKVSWANSVDVYFEYPTAPLQRESNKLFSSGLSDRNIVVDSSNRLQDDDN